MSGNTGVILEVLMNLDIAIEAMGWDPENLDEGDRL